MSSEEARTISYGRGVNKSPGEPSDNTTPSLLPRSPVRNATLWVLGRVLGGVIFFGTIGGSILLLRRLPVVMALFAAFLVLLSLTIFVLWWLESLSARTLLLWGLGCASTPFLVYAEILREEREAAGLPTGWDPWFMADLGLLCLLAVVWSAPHLLEKYLKRK